MKVIVGEDHNQIVKDDIDRYTLILYYAPDEQYSMEIMPLFEELAQELVGSQSELVIGKFNADMNEAEGLTLPGYPVLRLWTKGNKNSFVDFTSGERNLDSVMAWY